MEDRNILNIALSKMFFDEKFTKDYLFYAHIISSCTITINHLIKTPAEISFNNNYFKLHINNKIFDTYTIENQLAILKHEALHIINMHIMRKGNRNSLKWNISTDCAINQLINPLHLPPSSITPQNIEIDNCPLMKSAEFYYDLLKDEEDFKNIDIHSEWEYSELGEILEYTTKNIVEIAIDNTHKSRGIIPDNISEILELLLHKPELPWQIILKNIISSKKINSRRTLTKNDRRFNNREDIKGKIKKRSISLIVICDISGSMDNKDIEKGLNEIHHICKITNSAVDLIQIDEKIQSIEKFTPKTKILNRKGNGGTRLEPAINFINNYKIKYDIIIIITDGYIEDVKTWRNPPKSKVIFLITDNTKYINNKYKQYRLNSEI